MSHPAAVAAAAAAALAVLFAGCQSSAYHHRQADRIAADIIAQKQKQALGRAEPFTIERPEDTLRRRLMEAQALPATGPESLGTSKLQKPRGWPEKSAAKAPEAPSQPPLPPGPLKLSLFDALQVAASNSREYQSQKEDLFRSALDLDLRRNDFRSIFYTRADATVMTDLYNGSPDSALDSSTSTDWSRVFANGASITVGLAADFVKLLTGSHHSSSGVVADASVSIPLLRGAGKRIVTEPLTQAERSVVYAIYTFERYKGTFAVRVASDYLGVLQTLDTIKNAEENYRSLVTSARRARRLADAGRLPEIQVDQARQDELRARNRWIVALENYKKSLDSFKLTLGLPADAQIELDPEELDRLAAAAKSTMGDIDRIEKEDAPDAPAAGDDSPELVAGAAPPPADAGAPVTLQEPSREGAGPYEIDERQATELALANRLDLRTTLARLYDAQRRVLVAADALKSGLTLVAGGAFGGSRSPSSAALPDAELLPERGAYDVRVVADLPWNRTSQRNAYRRSLVDLERAERDLQQAEDQVKLDIRNDLRNLLTARESIKIQLVAVSVARRRVNSVELFLQAGRAEIRDLLDAQESLVSAQDSLTANLVDYRVATLALQRDMGLLETDEKGLWREYAPEKFKENP